MEEKSNQHQWLLWVLLGGGAMFVLSAACIVGAMILNVIHSKSSLPVTVTVAVAETIATPSPTTIPPTVTNTTTLMPTIQTVTLEPVLGDQLSLPTATFTPRPTSIATRTPTPIPGQSEGLRVGDIAPDFTVGNTRESRISLSDLRGKVVVLNFWATWCAPCRREVPALQAVHNEYGPQGVVVLAINVKEKVDTVAKFAQDNGISFNVWLDEDGWVSTIYDIHSIPITYFIDENGIIRAVHFGAMNREQITVQVQKLL